MTSSIQTVTDFVWLNSVAVSKMYRTYHLSTRLSAQLTGRTICRHTRFVSKTYRTYHLHTYKVSHTHTHARTHTHHTRMRTHTHTPHMHVHTHTHVTPPKLATKHFTVCPHSLKKPTSIRKQIYIHVKITCIISWHPHWTQNRKTVLSLTKKKKTTTHLHPYNIKTHLHTQMGYSLSPSILLPGLFAAAIRFCLRTNVTFALCPFPCRRRPCPWLGPCPWNWRPVLCWASCWSEKKRTSTSSLHAKENLGAKHEWQRNKINMYKSHRLRACNNVQKPQA